MSDETPTTQPVEAPQATPASPTATETPQNVPEVEKATEQAPGGIKTEEKPPVRDEKGLFQPGTAPGPGRPKGALAFKTAIEKWADREAAKEQDGTPVTKMELITKKLIEMAEAGNILAIKEIADRIDGKAKQSIDHTTLGERLGIDPLKQSLVNDAVKKMFEKKP